MKYSEAMRLASEARAFADWIETNGPALPGSPSVTIEARCYLSHNEYSKDDETGEWVTTLDEAQTKANLGEFLNAVGSCEKDYSYDRLLIKKKFGKTAQVFGSVDRQLTCKRKVVETKVIPAQTLPERVEEVVEWECDDAPSLLALVK